ncbi:MAG: DUF4397 domain-containing protein [Candidatus Nanopelagicales bacterium]
MSSRFRRIQRYVLAPGAALVVALGTITVPAVSANAAERRASVSVFHAISTGMGADVVDVYADGARIINNLKSGQLTNIRVRPGTYDIEIFLDGELPKRDEPVLALDDVTFLSGFCSTLTANLTETGEPTAEVFANRSARNPVGTGRVTVRHIAEAPPVDVAAGGQVIFGNLANGASATKRVGVDTYPITVALADSDTTVLGPTNLVVSRPFNTIVYAWGSAADGTLALKVQRIPVIR